jgi:alkanesulfonate monooxygenase SsuD/methylene tetrahydromethanopterin reductase-like flavin-dependent oxidoreductase (luciferase family)
MPERNRNVPAERASGDEIFAALMLPTATEPGRDLDAGRFSAVAQMAEEYGFDALWVGDHIVHPRPVMESVVTLSYVAARTTRIRVGTCVMLIALRKPVVLAKQLTTLAVLSGGRVDLGVGLGGAYESEWDACEVSMSERGERTERAVVAMRALLDGRLLDDDSRFPHLHGIRLEPGSPARVPLFFGGAQERALRRAGRLGDGWVGWLRNTTEFTESRHVIEAELGSGHAPFFFGMAWPTLVTGHDAAANEDAATRLGNTTGNVKRFRPEHMLAGRPESILARLTEFYALGCRHFGFLMLEQGPGFGDQLRAIAVEVLPGLRALARGS